MEKIVGTIISKDNGISYSVKWDSDTKYAWIKQKGKPSWLLACEEVRTAKDALACAQGHIDSQPGMF